MKIQKMDEGSPNYSTPNYSTIEDLAYVNLPDGRVYFFENRHTGKYAVMKYDSNGHWQGISIHNTFSEALVAYEKLNPKFYCIAEILPKTEITAQMHRWKSTIPTLKGYLEVFKDPSFFFCLYMDISTKHYPEGIEITQALANSIINNKRYNKRWFNDCVVATTTPEQDLGYGFTYQYGKYYFLGVMSPSDGVTYRFPSKIDYSSELKKAQDEIKTLKEILRQIAGVLPKEL